MGLAWNFGRSQRRACTSKLRAPKGGDGLDAEGVRRLIRTVAADLNALEEAASIRRRQIPGPARWLDPVNEAIERARVRVLGGLNDLRAALVFARTREMVGTREFAAKAQAKIAAAAAELDALSKRSVAELSALCPAVSVLQHVTVALRALESTTTDFHSQLQIRQLPISGA